MEEGGWGLDGGDGDNGTLLGHHRSAGGLRVPFDKLYAALARSLHAEQVRACF